MKSVVYRCSEDLSETPIQKGPEVSDDLSSHYSFNIQVYVPTMNNTWTSFRMLEKLS